MRKYYPKSLFSKLLPILLFTAVVILVYSCRKNSIAKQDSPSPATGYQIDLMALKADYISDTAVAGKNIMTAGVNGLPNLIKNMNVKWETLYYLRRTASRVIEFELDKNKNTVPVSPNAGQYINYHDKTDLVFLQFDNGNKMRFFMKVVETGADTTGGIIQNLHYNHIPNNFTGHILYYTTAKQLLCAYLISNGKTTGIYSPNTITNSGKTIQSASGKNSLDIFECTSWYWGDDDDGWDYIGTTCVTLVVQDGGGPPSAPGDGDGGGGSYNPCDPPSTGPLGPGTPNPPDPNAPPVAIDNIGVIGGHPKIMDISACPPDAITPPQVIDSVKNSCLKGMVDSIMSKNIKGKIDSMIQGVFGGTQKLNLTFTDQIAMQVATDDGEEFGQYDKNNPTVLIGAAIDLNAVTLATSSKEFIAATIMHEALHAYLDSKGIAIGDAQHDVMAANYVNSMANDLMAMFPGLIKDAAYSLAWGGLENTHLYSNPGTSVYIPTGQQYINTLYKFHTDTVGHRTFGHGC